MFRAVLAVSMTLLLSTAAYAWDQPSGANAGAAAAAAAGASALSANKNTNNNANLNLNQNAVRNKISTNVSNHNSVRSSNRNSVRSSNSVSGGNVTVNGGGYGGYGVASAVAPPSISTNPCSGSPAGVAVQGGTFGFGVNTGGGFDNSCRLANLGLSNVAFEYLCRVNDDIRKAAFAAGHPCAEDRQRYAQASYDAAIKAQRESERLEREQFQYVQRVNGAQRRKPDWCYEHLTPAERARHPECR